MKLIADILMIAGTFSVAVYCIVLAKRLSRFTDLEKGVGGAIAVLSAQVDDMTKMLTKAQKTAAGSAANLENLTSRAEDAAKRLELLMASMHDLPPPPKREAPQAPVASAETNPKSENSSPETLFLSRRSQVEAAE
ncbi:hypothetical protein [Pacificibacter marinus]|uniref:Uncharacterized protein n=1 Tax=Pacificibacter marinus TaxID=658057 RepID=A0A1Y5SY37_9RHOB|nr:hypothetical protein [Pacificibacter marinus]SEL05035.1 hypothetical protein SAMN04488032_110101 [Pacificibacter marinus]SLN51617.1 hypothetical protein PAM7971_02556 [Pacificibacter marinus]